MRNFSWKLVMIVGCYIEGYEDGYDEGYEMGRSEYEDEHDYEEYDHL